MNDNGDLPDTDDDARRLAGKIMGQFYGYEYGTISSVLMQLLGNMVAESSLPGRHEEAFDELIDSARDVMRRAVVYHQNRSGAK